MGSLYSSHSTDYLWRKELGSGVVYARGGRESRYEGQGGGGEDQEVQEYLIRGLCALFIVFEVQRSGWSRKHPESPSWRKET